MKRMLVTGGAGFIGSNFIRLMLRKYYDYRIVNLDKLAYAGNLDNLKDIEQDSRYSFVKGDIADKKLVFDLCSQGFDYIVNFAAETHVDRSIGQPDDFIKTDIMGTFTLLEAVREFKIPRFLQISTDEVYGSIEQGSFTEASPLLPNSPYSASKGGADLLVRSYVVTYGIDALITRSSNNYGAYQHPEKFIPLFIINALNDRELPLYGEGLNVRDWLHVIDNCQAIDMVLHEGIAGEIYNIGGEHEEKNIDVARMIVRRLGKPESLIVPVKDRPGHDKRYSLDTSKIKSLGWKPRTDFEKGLNDTVDWYASNRWWWEKIINSQQWKRYYDRQYNKR